MIDKEKNKKRPKKIKINRIRENTRRIKKKINKLREARKEKNQNEIYRKKML